jgi:Fe-S cluster assembly scaffold protein SufB
MKKKLTIICDSNFEIETNIDTYEEIDHRIIVFSHLENTSCIAKFHLDNWSCSAQVSILWIIHNQKKVHIDGQILIWPRWENTSWHLNEEVLIIGNHSYTFTKPVLDVAHNAVSASHGAKIHKIPKNQLFYLMSRGLSEWEAKQIIIWWLIEKMFEWDPEVEIIGTPNNKDINKEKIIQRIYGIIFQ